MTLDELTDRVVMLFVGGERASAFDSFEALVRLHYPDDVEGISVFLRQLKRGLPPEGLMWLIDEYFALRKPDPIERALYLRRLSSPMN